jgi:hypothetical protein
MKALRKMWLAMQALWLLYTLCYKMASVATVKATTAHQRVDALLGNLASGAQLVGNASNVAGGSNGSFLASISQAITAGSDLGGSGSLGSSAAGTVATTSSFPAPQVAYVQALANDYNDLRTDVSNLYSFCNTLSARCNGIKDHLQSASLMGP